MKKIRWTDWLSIGLGVLALAAVHGPPVLAEAKSASESPAYLSEPIAQVFDVAAEAEERISSVLKSKVYND